MIREVPVAEPVLDYAARLVMATHPEGQDSPDIAKRFVRYGASPRAIQTLVLAGKVNALLSGRYNVSFDDLRRVRRQPELWLRGVDRERHPCCRPSTQAGSERSSGEA